eukprot:scaffold64273_cov72-Phaeocystis_antarctica.AAC.2
MLTRHRWEPICARPTRHSRTWSVGCRQCRVRGAGPSPGGPTNSPSALAFADVRALWLRSESLIRDTRACPPALPLAALVYRRA